MKRESEQFLETIKSYSHIDSIRLKFDRKFKRWSIVIFYPSVVVMWLIFMIMICLPFAAFGSICNVLVSAFTDNETLITIGHFMGLPLCCFYIYIIDKFSGSCGHEDGYKAGYKDGHKDAQNNIYIEFPGPSFFDDQPVER